MPIQSSLKGLTAMVDTPGGTPTIPLLNVQAPPALPPDHMLEDEYVDAYQNWKAAPSPQTSRTLIGKLQPVIDKAVTSYGGRQGGPILQSRARLMALEGLPKYDPTRSKLQTYMLTHLRGLQRAASGDVIHVPERVRLDLNTVYKAEKELTDKLGREPTQEELADYTGLSTKRLNYIQQGRRMTTTTGQVHSLEEQSANANINPAVEDTNADPWLDFVYEDLNPRDKLIMAYALGRYGKRKLGTNAIAQKLNITPGAVSQRLGKIQQLLNQREELDLGL